MKPEALNLPTTVSRGVKSHHNFSINVCAESFRLLSSGLYSDPIKAIVRELSTNAWDSHVVAGNAHTPFDVDLPTMMSSNWRIRDYGTGMTPEVIRNIYTSYFSSDKQDSNDVVGMMGLGSKSPLGYTNMMTLVSYVDGNKYLYSISMGDTGFPVLAEHDVVPTTKPNGVEIIIPVKKNDFYKFEVACLEVYKWFEVKPKFNKSLEINTPNYMDGMFGKAKLIPKDKNTNNRQFSHDYVVMGNIAYPIDSYHISYEHRKHISYSSLVFFADIGDVGFTPSREALDYSDRTKAALEKMYADAYDALDMHLRKDIDAATSVFEMWKLETLPIYRKFVVSNVFEDKYEELVHYYNDDSTPQHPSIAKLFELAESVCEGKRGTSFSITKVGPKTLAKKGWSNKVTPQNCTNIVVTYNGVRKLSSNQWATIYASPNFEKNTIYVHFRVPKKKPEDVIDAIKDAFIDVDVNPLSDYVDMDKLKIVRTSTTKAKSNTPISANNEEVVLLPMKNKYAAIKFHAIESIRRSVSHLKQWDEVVYLELKRNTPVDDSLDWNKVSVVIYENSLFPKVYGASSRAVKILKTLPNAVDLKTYLKKRLSSVSNEEKAQFIKTYLYNKVDYVPFLTVVGNVSREKNLPITSKTFNEFLALMDQYNTAKNLRVSLHDFRRADILREYLANALSVSFPKHGLECQKEMEAVKELVDKIEKYVPAFDMFTNNTYNADFVARKYADDFIKIVNAFVI